MTAEALHHITMRFNFRGVGRGVGDWDEESFDCSFVPRVGDRIWVAPLKDDLTVRNVMIIPPQRDAMQPRLWALLDMEATDAAFAV